jgi:hypothetical protein
MREQATKLQVVERVLSKSHGPFELFALFLREDASNKWDLLISSDWARADKKGSLSIIVREIKKVLTSDEQLMLSRLIVLEKDNVALNALQSAMHVEHGMAEVQDCNFNGLVIKHAYLITSKRIS